MKRDSISALVSVIEVAEGFGFDGKSKDEFKTRVELIREEKSYRFVLSSLDREQISHSLAHLESAEPVKNRNDQLYLSFRGGLWVHLKFQHKYFYSFFLTVMDEFLQLRKYIRSIDDNKKKGSKRVKPRRERRTCTSYKPTAPEYNNGVRKKKKGLSFGVCSSEDLSPGSLSGHSVDEDRERKFYQIPSSNWTNRQILFWFDHILIQKESSKREEDEEDEEEGEVEEDEEKESTEQIQTLFEYIGEENYRTGIDRYFSVPVDERLRQKTYEDLYELIKTYEKSEGKECDDLIDLLQDDYIRKTLKIECELIMNNRGMFNVHFYLFLKNKIIPLVKSSQKEQQKEVPNLHEIKKQLLSHEELRSLWSVEDCRNQTLSKLVFQKPRISEIINDIETQFFELERREFYGEEEEMSVKDIDGRRWEKMLHDYSKERCGGESICEDISDRIRRSKKVNDIRLERRDLRESYDKIDLGKLQEDLEESIEKCKKWREKYKNNEAQIKKLVEEEEDGEEENQVKIERRRKMSSKLDLEVLKGDMKREEAENKLKFYQRKKKKLLDVIKKDDLGNEIMIEVEKLMKNEDTEEEDTEEKRRRNKRKRIAIRDYFLHQISQLTRGKMTDLQVKLIVSICTRKKKEISGRILQCFGLKEEEEEEEEEYLHFSCEIGNTLLVQWCHDDMVDIKLLLSEPTTKEENNNNNNNRIIMIVDCDCPVFSNNHIGYYNRITKLSEEIISSNIEQKYSDLKVMVVGKDHSVSRGNFQLQNDINSLEFCSVVAIQSFIPVQMNQNLFFKPLKVYLNDLGRFVFAKRSASEEEGENKNSGCCYITVNERFRKFYQLVKQSKSSDESLYVPDKKNRIYFEKHSDLDEFCKFCFSEQKKKSKKSKKKKKKKKKGEEEEEKNEDDDDGDDGMKIMKLNFPGEYQLLKAFDLAFWKSGGKEDGSCPFQEIHEEKESEEVEEEEEVEGEEEED